MSDPPSDARRDPGPEPPRGPQPEECCGSGCGPCVYDVYWDKLERYEQALRDWQARHPGGGS